jgi:hypothetical protein
MQLKKSNLPIPDDLKADFEPSAEIAQPQQPQLPGTEAPAPQILPTPGTGTPAPTEALTPTPDEEGGQEGGDDASQDGSDDPSGQEGGSLIPLPRNKAPQRPPESDEQRKKMPKASARTRALGSLIDGPGSTGTRKYANIDRSKPLDEQR